MRHILHTLLIYCLVQILSGVYRSITICVILLQPHHHILPVAPSNHSNVENLQRILMQNLMELGSLFVSVIINFKKNCHGSVICVHRDTCMRWPALRGLLVHNIHVCRDFNNDLSVTLVIT